jgi:hypothetical protein
MGRRSSPTTRSRSDESPPRPRPLIPAAEHAEADARAGSRTTRQEPEDVVVHRDVLRVALGEVGNDLWR